MAHIKIFRTILFTYIIIALVGAYILNFDIMRTRDISFLDLLFTSTSALSVTGLVVKNSAIDFTAYGQGVILALIQIGGFGYMGFATIFFMLIGGRISFENRQLLKESMSYPSMRGILKFIKKIFIYVFVIEFVGALILTLDFWVHMPFKEALWFGIFHSISAFNNAGFSIFEAGLSDFRSDVVLNLTITSLIILGGFGFLVLNELRGFFRSKTRLSIHSKLVLIASATLIILAMALLLILEWSNPNTLGKLGYFDKFLSSYFASVNLRTSGFNTLDLGSLNDASLFFSSIFMIIGGAPGGTAGGLKVTVIAVLFVYTYCTLKQKDPVVFKREIPAHTINKAIVASVLSIFYIVITVMILSVIEDRIDFLSLLFEVSSAFGTVGLSVGNGGDLSLSANFDDFGKIYIILLMILGKLGVLAFSIAIVGKQQTSKIKHTQGEVIL